MAASSLLEFALADIPSFGVGRIRSMFMYPMSFEEYSWASDEKPLADAITTARPTTPLQTACHEKEALELLIMADLVIPVTHTSANGLPLGAEANSKKQKMLLLDTINKGAIAEQFVGLELLKAQSCYRQHSLYYWQREAKSSSAEVDYLIQQHDQIVPIEVKSGTKGSMQSLYIFLDKKKRPMGIRTSLENFGAIDRVQTYPLYAVGKL